MTDLTTTSNHHLMTRDQMDDAVRRLRESVENQRDILLEIYKGQGWKAYNYKSMDDWLDANEFEASARHFKRLAKWAQVKANTGIEMPETHAREISDLTPEQQKALYLHAIDVAPHMTYRGKDSYKNGTVTASLLKMLREQNVAALGDGATKKRDRSVPKNLDKNQIEHPENGSVTPEVSETPSQPEAKADYLPALTDGLQPEMSCERKLPTLDGIANTFAEAADAIKRFKVECMDQCPWSGAFCTKFCTKTDGCKDIDNLPEDDEEEDAQQLADESFGDLRATNEPTIAYPIPEDQDEDDRLLPLPTPPTVDKLEAELLKQRTIMFNEDAFAMLRYLCNRPRGGTLRQLNIIEYAHLMIAQRGEQSGKEARDGKIFDVTTGEEVPNP